MLMEPASKVSVPLTVVMRTRSRVAESCLDPEIVCAYGASEPVNIPLATHVLAESSKENEMLP